MTREEAIEVIKANYPSGGYHDLCEALDMAISALSEKDWKFYYDHGYAQAKRDLSENKGEWIPISERLPEIHQDILLELRSGEMLTGFKAETEPYFYCHGVDGCYVEPQNVLAWQPLPEPYKAESEE